MEDACGLVLMAAAASSTVLATVVARKLPMKTGALISVHKEES
jgi:hypothetical protein